MPARLTAFFARGVAAEAAFSSSFGLAGPLAQASQNSSPSGISRPTLDTLHGSVPLFPDFTTFFDGCKYNMDDHAVQKRLQMYRPRAMLKEIEREKGVGNNEKMRFPGSGADSAAGGLRHAAARQLRML